MDDQFIEGIYDDLDDINPSMSKDEILAEVDSVMSSIEEEMGWEEDGPESEEEVAVE